MTSCHCSFHFLLKVHILLYDFKSYPLYLAPPTLNTMMATRAIQPNFIISESAFMFKYFRTAFFDITIYLCLIRIKNNKSIKKMQSLSTEIASFHVAVNKSYQTIIAYSHNNPFGIVIIFLLPSPCLLFLQG